MSDRSTVHQTSTVIAALVPGGASKPDVSTVTRMFVQCRLSLASAVVALVVAMRCALLAERAMEASRAAIPATPLIRSPARAMRAPDHDQCENHNPNG
jgi:hypothetical protein